MAYLRWNKVFLLTSTNEIIVSFSFQERGDVYYFSNVAVFVNLSTFLFITKKVYKDLLSKN